MASDLAAELAAFAKTIKTTGGVQCRTCALPEPIRKVIEAERVKNGTSTNVLAKWLKSKGYPIPDTTLRRHLHLHISE